MIRVTEEKITEYLGKIPFTFKIFDELESTNLYAKQSVGKELNNHVIIADKQTAGRGRCGRDFYSPEGNGIYMSAVIKADKKFEDIELLTVAVAAITHKAIEKVSGCNCEIKWVNDIYLNKKKICGILCENILDKNSMKVKHIIIGIGINVKSTENFPRELQNKAGAIAIPSLDRNFLIAEILKGIYNLSENFELDDYLSYYREHSMVLNKMIRFNENGKEMFGRAVEINSSGNLVVELLNNEKRILRSGEISIGVSDA
ncbi:MAG: biotin--[acetyl-CoA-carboxylase] ligase [Ruminococcaceae bacterium]|nr:biotin--[acetyl-CoA-carboxylase] ligase [Oscillospiraceae bacterium]